MKHLLNLASYTIKRLSQMDCARNDGKSSDTTDRRITEEQLTAVYSHLLTLDHILTAMMSVEHKMYSDARTENIENMKSHVEGLKANLPDYVDDIPI